ncbi:hypothetical protein GYA49_04490 [Candidatus Beckwithbacteria bacterium]|nr:hypothetical protein [Candidatus Beckwithbacteria bacterium]
MINDQTIYRQIQENPDFRKALAQESLMWFFAIYFPHYITSPTADFQKEMLELFQNKNIRKVVITAFRGSAKSTLGTLVYPIWSLVGKPQKKYTLVMSQTQELAKQILTNIKEELSTNELLLRDFGGLSQTNEWRSNSIVIPYYNARISATSQSESIRGLRHKQYRPDLVIVDDVENLESVKTRENRDKLWDWFTGEVMPIGDVHTKIVVVGNLLHEDSLMMRLKENITLGKMDGVYREYPLINAKGEITWPGKYPTMKHVEIKRRQVADDSAWYREYLLKFISDDNRIVQRNWPQVWTELPDLKRYPPHLVGLGVDMALSESSSADLTALIPFICVGYGDNLKVYILDYIVNKRLNFTDAIKEIKKVCEYFDEDFKRMPTVYVEKANIETAATQLLRLDKVLSEPVDTSRMSKQERLQVSTPYIRVGKVLFPPKGAEQLISQIINFGIEKHDDLVDAFTLIVIKVLATDRPTTHFTQNESKEDPHPGLTWSLRHMSEFDIDEKPITLDMVF